MIKKEKIPTKEELNLLMLKDRLEMSKDRYNTYIEVLIKYNFPEIAYSAIKTQDQLDNVLGIKMEQVKDDPKEFHEFLFGKPYNDEEDRIRGEIKYYDNLISYCKSKINRMDHDTKKKIAEDDIEKTVSWLSISLKPTIKTNTKVKKK